MRREVPHWRPRLLWGGAVLFAMALCPPFARSSDWSFAPNVRVHPDNGGQHLWPDVVAGAGGLIASAWMDNHDGEFHIYFSRSTDAGDSWSEPERIDDRQAGSSSRFVSLALTPSGVPIAVWEDDRLGEFNVYFSRRDPVSGAWSPNGQVNTTGSSDHESDILNASIDVYNDQRWFVAWTDWREGPVNQIYTRSTLDAGQTWGFERRISDETGVQPMAADPCLVVDRTSPPNAVVVHCVGNCIRGPNNEDRFPNVFHFKSLNGGGTWQRGTQVNDIEPYFQQVASRSFVVMPNGNLVCGWLNDETGVADFRTSLSPDGGDHWLSSVQVNQDSEIGTGTFPCLAVAGNTVIAGYDLFQEDWDCFMRSSSDGALSWSEPPVRIDDDATGAAGGNTVLAAASPNSVIAVWQDTRPGFGPWQIYSGWGHRSSSAVEGGVVSAWSVVPNPSRVGGEVRLVLPAGTNGDWSILSLDGRRVRTLSIGEGGAQWDGRDAAGRELPAGVYWAQPRSDDLGPIRIVRVR